MHLDDYIKSEAQGWFPDYDQRPKPELVPAQYLCELEQWWDARWDGPITIEDQAQELDRVAAAAVALAKKLREGFCVQCEEEVTPGRESCVC